MKVIRVYAAGDVTDTKGLPLTPLAGQESRAVSFNLLEEINTNLIIK